MQKVISLSSSAVVHGGNVVEQEITDSPFSLVSDHLSPVQFTVDLVKFEENLDRIRLKFQKENKAIFIVVKSNAYGHGMVSVAEVLQRKGFDKIAVARVDEGVKLRSRGYEGDILVLGLTNPNSERLEAAVDHNLILSYCDLKEIETLSHIAQKKDKDVRVHIKVETGMNRIGMKPDDVLPFAFSVKNQFPNIKIDGIFTHFSDADSDPTFTLAQIESFKSAVNHLEKCGFRPTYVHAANSVGSIREDYQEALSFCNAVRMGKLPYGVPLGFSNDFSKSLNSLVRIKTEVTQVREISYGQAIGYGQNVRTKKNLKVAVIAVGFGDGLPRSGWGEVLINGERCKILSTAMDMAMVDITHLNQEVKPGGEVVLLGTQGTQELTLQEKMDHLGTIGSSILVAFTGRVPKSFVVNQVMTDYTKLIRQQVEALLGKSSKNFLARNMFVSTFAQTVLQNTHEKGSRAFSTREMYTLFRGALNRFRR